MGEGRGAERDDRVDEILLDAQMLRLAAVLDRRFRLRAEASRRTLRRGGLILALLALGLAGWAIRPQQASGQAGGTISICDPVGPGIAAVNIGSAGNISAATTGLVSYAQGATPNGTAVNGNPVLIGGSDGSNARTVQTTGAGAVAVAFVNSGGTPSSIPGDANGIFTESQLSLTNETVAWVSSLASNGASAVTIKAASNGKRVWPIVITVLNADTIEHVFTLKSSGGTVVYVARVPAGSGSTNNITMGQLLLGETDLRASMSAIGDGLQFSSDAQAGALLFVQAALVQR